MNKIFLVGLVALAGFGCSEAGKSVAGGISAPPYFVKATVTDNVYSAATRFVKLCVDADTSKVNGCDYSDSVSMSGSSSAFNVINIPAGTFYIYAFKDADSNGVLNSGDALSDTQVLIMNSNQQLSAPVVLQTVL